MAEVVISFAGIQSLQQQLRLLGVNLGDMLLTATEEIAGDTRDALATIYPGGLSAQWQVTTGDGAGTAAAIASVTARSADPYVLWFEYGTKPHAITPRNAAALAFVAPWSGAIEFFKIVHQSERAHNGAVALRIALETSAYTRWSEAIQALLDDINLG